MNTDALIGTCLQTFANNNNIPLNEIQLLSTEEGYSPWEHHSNDPNQVHTAVMPPRVIMCKVNTPMNRFLITIRTDGRGPVQWGPIA
jgi:hypothetical protein